MDKLRFKRYRDKIEYIILNIKDLPYNPRNDLEKRGILYSIQTAIEAGMDLISMQIKDMGYEVGDNFENIDKLLSLKKMDTNYALQLKKINGLRNIIVHRYNNIDEELVLNSVSEVKKILLHEIELIEGFLIEKTKT